MRSHTLGADVAEVFVCSPSAGPEPMSMSAAVSLVAQAGGLFERASGGRYLLQPVPGSTVRGGDPTECVSEASERSAGAADLAVVVGVCDHLPGGSGPGGQPGSVANGLPSPSGRFPGSGRWDRAFVLLAALRRPRGGSLPYQGDIAAIAAAGITKGCNPPAGDRFCPDAPVTRGQVAAFLVRALRHSSSGAGS